MATRTMAEYRKFLVAVVGLIAQGVALGLFHGRVLDWAVAIVALATAVGVRQVPNEKPQVQTAARSTIRP